MSKTQQTIFNELLAEKNAQADLSALNSTSNTAIWRLWLWMVAFAHKLLYDAWDVTKSEIATLTSQQIHGTNPWYEGLCLNWTSGTVPIDVASCKEVITPTVRKVVVKVATMNTGTNQLVTIPQADLIALRAYLFTKKIKGTDLDLVTQSADLLWLALSIKYTGTLSVVKSAVTQAIKDYLQNLVYGSDFSPSLLVNDLYSVPNVLVVTMDSAKLNIGLGYVLQSQTLILTDAGYFEIGQDSSNNDLLDLNMYQ